MFVLREREFSHSETDSRRTASSIADRTQSTRSFGTCKRRTVAIPTVQLLFFVAKTLHLVANLLFETLASPQCGESQQPDRNEYS